MNRLSPDASTECKMVALLHDVIEDTTYTAEDLLRMGYPENVVASVQRLSKPKFPISIASRRLSPRAIEWRWRLSERIIRTTLIPRVSRSCRPTNKQATKNTVVPSKF
jgi:hypothetical protein